MPFKSQCHLLVCYESQTDIILIKCSEDRPMKWLLICGMILMYLVDAADYLSVVSLVCETNESSHEILQILSAFGIIYFISPHKKLENSANVSCKYNCKQSRASQSVCSGTGCCFIFYFFFWVVLYDFIVLLATTHTFNITQRYQ